MKTKGFFCFCFPFSFFLLMMPLPCCFFLFSWCVVKDRLFREPLGHILFQTDGFVHKCLIPLSLSHTHTHTHLRFSLLFFSPNATRSDPVLLRDDSLWMAKDNENACCANHRSAVHIIGTYLIRLLHPFLGKK